VLAICAIALALPVPRDATEAAASPDSARVVVPLGEDLEVRELQDGIWLHTSRNELGPANGMILVNDAGVLVVDTPWTDEQTARLVAWIHDRLQRPIRHWVVTHFHADCMGGIRTVHEQGIPTLGQEQTAELAKGDGNPPPARLFSEQIRLALGPDTAEVFYPGPAHSPDNIVVWLPERRVLFGGCMIRSAASRGIHYAGVADFDAWPESVARVRERYPDVALVIPGHGRPGGQELFEHTIRLVRARAGKPK
jgi:glyoxylase-like metal-dependent hydrolase (beta-lactamase superfamily II)